MTLALARNRSENDIFARERLRSIDAKIAALRPAHTLQALDRSACVYCLCAS
jgi:hypothetical protein